MSSDVGGSWRWRCSICTSSRSMRSTSIVSELVPLVCCWGQNHPWWSRVHVDLIQNQNQSGPGPSMSSGWFLQPESVNKSDLWPLSPAEVRASWWFQVLVLVLDPETSWESKVLVGSAVWAGFYVQVRVLTEPDPEFCCSDQPERFLSANRRAASVTQQREELWLVSKVIFSHKSDLVI